MHGLENRIEQEIKFDSISIESISIYSEQRQFALQDSIQSFVYYSINHYGNIFVRSVDVVILNSKSKSSIVYTFISIHIRIFLLNTHKSNSNNEFHSYFIPFFECLFKSVGYDTINYNPVHSLDCLYSIVSNLASDLSGITHFYFEH